MADTISRDRSVEETRRSKSFVTRCEPRTTSAIPPTRTGWSPFSSSAPRSGNSSPRGSASPATGRGGLSQGVRPPEVLEVLPDPPRSVAGERLRAAALRRDFPPALRRQLPRAGAAPPAPEGPGDRSEFHAAIIAY